MNRKTRIYASVFMLSVVVVIANFVIFKITNQPNYLAGLQPEIKTVDLYDVTGSPEFMAKWNEWKSLPESRKSEWLPEPGFEWMEDYLNLVAVSDAGISPEDFETWVLDGFGYVDKENRVPIPESQVNSLQTDTVMFDCRPYVLDDELKSAIQSAPRLTWLRLPEEYKENDLEWLTDLERLKGLSLKGVKLRNRDLTWLAKFENLKWLELEFGAGNQLILPSLLELEVLRMTGRGITDQLLPVAEQFPKLKSLDVDSSEVTDDGVAQIAKNCPRLVKLDLGWCFITYDCVASLAQLKALRYLYVNHTPLESQASGFAYGTIPELQIKLPKCHIRIGER